MLNEFTEDKPHYNTLSSIVRNLEEKGSVAHEAFGNTLRYYPLISKEEYRKKFANIAIMGYYNYQ
ncbi:BlaI/MecI/CopY family transcriptional regulator [Imtechella halotolerans]|uniref:BlaI/MecI/CopY family transcriptional regulator n=1 Tax=Imtechella halotolerans TaxID=1165090 RepID=UPI0030B7F7BB